jgi:hypothetical protein
LIHAGQDFHQRGFAGAVLAAEGMDGAAPDLERYIRQRLDRSESLANAAHAERSVHGGIVVISSRRFKNGLEFKEDFLFARLCF